MIKRTIQIVITLAAIATISVAGEMWHVTCVNPKCKLDARFTIGGGFIFEQVTGYCTTCQKFVSLSWARHSLTGADKTFSDKTSLPNTPPRKIGTVWNAATGRTATLYPCPYCTNLFMTIDYLPEDLSLIIDNGSMKSSKIICPKCTNLTLRAQSTGWID
jgi:hypothetical protein